MIVRLAYYPGSGHAKIGKLLQSAFGLKISDDIGQVPFWPDMTNPASAPLEFERLKWRLHYAESVSNEEEKTIYVVEHPHTAIHALNARLAANTAPDISIGSTILGANEFGSWGAHIRAWDPLKRANTITVRLEDITREPDQVIDAISNFLDLKAKQGALQRHLEAGAKHSNSAPISSELNDEDLNLVSFLFKDQMKQFGYSSARRINRVQALARISEVSKGLIPAQTTETPANSGQIIQDLENRDQTRLSQISDLTSKLSAALRKVDDLGQRNDSLQEQNAKRSDYLQRVEQAIEPRLKSILTLRPLRFALSLRNQIKRGTVTLDSSGVPVFQSETDLPSLPARQRDTSQVAAQSQPLLSASPSIYASYKPQQPLGIAVFAYDRGENIENVLESLALQTALDHTHVWIDGDQGNPNKKKRLDETEERISRFTVKQVHRNRGNFGFRKMMIISMRKMFEQYERVLFLEDDCFPTRYAVQGFGYELDLIENNPNIMSVYGHPFLVDSEQNGSIGRFQSWGWASTRDKLMPLWPSLLDTYLMSEDEYQTFVAEHLSQDILDHIDVTPGRQPSSTLPKFFAWDETLGFLAAVKGMRHKPTTERLIFNFGVGASSTHFNRIEHYRAPPFNMVTIDEIWRHF